MAREGEKCSKRRRRHDLCGCGGEMCGGAAGRTELKRKRSSHSPPLVRSVVGGVVEAGDGVAGRHHELTLRCAVGDQTVCRRDDRQRRQAVKSHKLKNIFFAGVSTLITEEGRFC